MADKSEVIIEQMEDTRKELADRLARLEQKLAGTVETVSDTVTTITQSVENVKDSIAETVENVIESVDDTVETVKESVADFFDVSAHVRNHPWLMMGGSVLVGFLGGRLLQLQRTEEAEAPSAGPTFAPPVPAPSPAREEPRRAPAEERTAAAPEGSGLLTRLADQFAPQISHIKGVALGTLFGIVRDMASSWVPESLRQDVRQMIDGFTSDLGGQVIASPVLGTAGEGAERTE